MASSVINTKVKQKRHTLRGIGGTLEVKIVRFKGFYHIVHGRAHDYVSIVSMLKSMTFSTQRTMTHKGQDYNTSKMRTSSRYVYYSAREKPSQPLRLYVYNE